VPDALRSLEEPDLLAAAGGREQLIDQRASQLVGEGGRQRRTKAPHRELDDLFGQRLVLVAVGRRLRHDVERIRGPVRLQW